MLAHSKKVNTTVPLQADAALVWAFQIATELGAANVIFESDSKECIDALKNPYAQAPWRIRNCVCNFLMLSNVHPHWFYV